MTAGELDRTVGSLPIHPAPRKGGDSTEQALDRACAQLIDRDYASEVLAAGATSVYQYGVVFDGKRCWVKVV